MEKNSFFLPLTVNEMYAGFVLTEDMAGYENIVVTDQNIPSNCKELTVSITGNYLRQIVLLMENSSLNVQTINILLFKDFNKINYVGLNDGKAVEFIKHGIAHYEIVDLSGYGNALYVDSCGDLKKNIDRAVKIEIRTFKNGDGSNWTVVHTSPKWEKKIATHNSLTYSDYYHGNFDNIKNRHAKCQNISVVEQYEKGIRMFDFRVRWNDKTNKPIVAHGLVEFTADIEAELAYLNTKPNVFVKIMLENFGASDAIKEKDYEWFRNEYMPHLLRDYPNIKFVGGYTKKGDVKLVDIANVPENEEYIDSGGLTAPLKYAKENNWKNKEKINYSSWSFFDFIDIGLDL